MKILSLRQNSTKDKEWEIYADPHSVWMSIFR